MSKYNNGKSISFSELKEDEIEQAIREWSQGNVHMEKLLWACRDNGIETLGCHPLKHPYLELTMGNSHKAISKMLYVAQNILGSQILIYPDGGNPLSGEKTWYIPRITIGFDTSEMKEVNETLDKLYEAIVLDDKLEMQEGRTFANMLDFYDFFAEKESGISYLTMRHDKSGLYQFLISYEESAYCKSIFRKAGMKLNKNKWGYLDWVIEDRDEIKFDEKVRKAKTTIMNEYPLGLTQEIKPNMNLTIQVRIIRRQFGNAPEGKQKFSEWLNNTLELYLDGKITYEECFSLKEAPDKTAEYDER